MKEFAVQTVLVYLWTNTKEFAVQKELIPVLLNWMEVASLQLIRVGGLASKEIKKIANKGHSRFGLG